MKNIKSIIVASIAIAAGAMTSCTNKMDNWGTDASYNRLFSVTSLDVTPEATTALVEYGGVAGAEAYQIQYSTSQMNDDMDVTQEGTTVVESTAKSSYELSNLIGETNYYLRIRATAQGKQPSKWIYYKTSSGVEYFTTKGEQIMNNVTSADITESSIHVSWTPGAQVTHLLVHQSGDEENANDKKITLDDAAKTAGEYTVTGLTASTVYEISLWNNESKRGKVTAATSAAMPSADYQKVLTAEETLISADILKELADKAAADGKTSYGVTLGIPAGATVDLYSIGSEGNANLKIPDGMSITFFGMAGGDAPTVKFKKNIDMEGTHGYIAFENLKIVNDGAGYFINQSKACNVGVFSVKDCEVSGFVTAFFRLQGTDVKIVGKLTLDNSVFHDMCSGYSFIHVDAGSGKGVVNNIDIDNSTLYNIATGGKMFIYSKNTNMESISVSNTTFYNCIGNNNYWVDFGSADYGCSAAFEFVKCLFTKTPDDVTKHNRASNTITFTDCWKTADFFKNFECNAYESTAEDIFTDPAHADFTLKISDQVGDPRWYKK